MFDIIKNISHICTFIEIGQHLIRFLGKRGGSQQILKCPINKMILELKFNNIK